MDSSSTTSVDRFREISPDQFEGEINRLWTAATSLRETVVEQVQSEQIPPMTGLGILACVTAQIFGYGLFHGEPAPADLVATLTGPGLAAGSRR